MSVKNKIPYTIYCDMDGVLCDFDLRFDHFTGISPKEYKTKAVSKFGDIEGMKRFWNLIDIEVGVRFWRGMSWMPEGKKLWNYIKGYNPILLTSPSQHRNSRIGKAGWVEDHLGDFRIIFEHSSSKHIHATPNSILIDDRVTNIEDWKSKNGIGFLYDGNNLDDIIRELKKLGI